MGMRLIFKHIRMIFCKHNFKKISPEFELEYRPHYFGMVAEHKCDKCLKNEFRTTSNIYIKLPIK